MNFKEYVQHDIPGTFMSQDEFASKANINCVEVSVIEDKDQLLHRIEKDYEAMGLNIGDILFYISLEEWGKITHVSPVPTVHEAISYNGRPCTITVATAQEGIFEITLQKTGTY